MTTNVFSLLPTNKVMACDSRWSRESDELVCYIDDSGYNKIVFNGTIVAMFAGNLGVVEKFKRWIKRDCEGVKPKSDGVSVVAYNIHKHECFSDNVVLAYPSDGNPEALFSGTGSVVAFKKWKQDRDSIKCVEIACLTDIYSGGLVRFFNTLTLENNIPVEKTQFFEIPELIKEKGFVMKKNDSRMIPVPYKEAIKLYPEIVDDLEGMLSDISGFEAPDPAALVKRSKEQERKLYEFFEEGAKMAKEMRLKNENV